MGAKIAMRLVACVFVAMVVTEAPAIAASPASGKISPKATSVKWSGGPFYISRPVGCLGPGDATCDYFFLKVNLGEGAKIQIKLVTPHPANGGIAPVQGDDYDIYVWGPEDVPIAEGDGANEGNETITFIHHARLRNYPYEIEVVPYAVAPGSKYSARAKALTRGY